MLRIAAEKLLSLVYDELDRLVAVKMAREKPGQTLQATALVDEAYIRLFGTYKASVGTQLDTHRAARLLDSADPQNWLDEPARSLSG